MPISKEISVCYVPWWYSDKERLRESQVEHNACCRVCYSEFEWAGKQKAFCPTCKRYARASEGKYAKVFAQEITITLRK